MHDIDLQLKLFIDLLSSRINDLLKLLENYCFGRLFWPTLSTIGLSDFHTIVLTVVNKVTTQCWSATHIDTVQSESSHRLTGRDKDINLSE